MMRRKKRMLIFIILLVLLLAGLFLDLNAGYSSISPGDMAKIFLGGGTRAMRYNFLELRMPRVITAMLCGMGLAVSGCVLQGVTRNDLADPGILGLNAGSGLMVALFIVFFTGSATSATLLFPLLAFAGAALTAAVEYRLALFHGKLSPSRLLLMGVAISLAITSATTMMMLRMPDSQYAFVNSWISGSIWGADWQNLAWMAPILVILIITVLYKGRVLDILELGENISAGLGVSVSKSSVQMIALAAGCSALCSAVGGGLSFVGLVCPHLARRLVGPQSRVLIPASVLCGGVLLVYADIVSRTMFLPNEIPVGIVTAVIGAPYFLYLLMKEKS